MWYYVHTYAYVHTHTYALYYRHGVVTVQGSSIPPSSPLNQIIESRERGILGHRGGITIFNKANLLSPSYWYNGGRCSDGYCVCVCVCGV